MRDETMVARQNMPNKQKNPFKQDYTNHWANIVKKIKTHQKHTLKSELLFALLQTD